MRASLAKQRLDVAVAAARLDALEREVEDDSASLLDSARHIAPGLLIGLGLAAGFLAVIVPGRLKRAALWGLVQMGFAQVLKHVGRT